MNDTAIDIPGISNTNRASKLMDEMGPGKSGRSVVRQSTQSVKEEGGRSSSKSSSRWSRSSRCWSTRPRSEKGDTEYK